MSKEMIISSSRHETKIALTEDGQVVEVYVEREKEVGLVGSIYKGRVSRVLPGMQSAFVDIGLDRDAFLYVSDFSENLEGTDHAPASESEDGADDASERSTSTRKRSTRRGRNGRRSRSSRNRTGTATATPSKPEATAASVEDPSAITDTSAEEPDAENTPSSPAADSPVDAAADKTAQGSTEKNVVPGEEPELTLPEHRPKGRSRSTRPRRSRSVRNSDSRGRGTSGRSHTTRRPSSRSISASNTKTPAPFLLPGESIAKFKRSAPPASESEQIPSESELAPTQGEPIAQETSPVNIGDESPVTAAVLSEEETLQESTAPETATDSSIATSSEPATDTEAAVTEPETGVENDLPAPPSSETEQEEKSEEDHEEDTENETASDTETTIATDENSGNNDSEASLDEFPSEAFASETRDELDDTLADIQRFRQYEDEVGLPPSVQERTDEGVEWPDEEEIEEAVGDETEKSDEPEEETTDESGAEAVKPEVAEGEAEKTKPSRKRTVRRRVRGRRTSSTSRTTGRGTRHTTGRTAGRPRTSRPRRTSARPSQGQPAISELLKAGQEIIVQIAKSQIGQKGARITSHVTLPGRYLVYMPTIEHIGVSRKIGTAEERARLRRTLVKMKGTASGGFVVRTAAADCANDELQADVDYLVRLWREMRGKYETESAPVILHQDLDLIQRLLRDQLGRSYDNIWIDNEEEYTNVVEFVSKFLPQFASKVKLYTRDEDIFEEMGVQQEIDRALRPKVWLKSGGYIVVNQTEALVAIDINTGKFVGKGSTRLEDTIVKTNLEAIKEIVRQVRLRDLGGIIVIDFIDMEDRRNRQKVMRALEDALQADRQPSKILSFNEFGLVAITRKRSKQSLERVLCQPCPYCTGTGMLKSIQSLCIEIQNEARKMAFEMDAPELTIRANPDIVTALKGEASGLIKELEEEFSKNIILQPDESLHFEHYNIF